MRWELAQADVLRGMSEELALRSEVEVRKKTKLQILWRRFGEARPREKPALWNEIARVQASR